MYIARHPFLPFLFLISLLLGGMMAAHGADGWEMVWQNKPL